MRKAKTIEDFSWINNDPEEVDVNDDGSEFIPVYFVEKKLDRLDPLWGTENFQFQLLRANNGFAFAHCSLELVVFYGGRTRRLVGTVTMIIPADTDFNDPMVNSNFAATGKSLATCNAAKPIGPAFGQKLNDRGIISNPSPEKKNGRQKKEAIKMPADRKIREAYAIAVTKGESEIVQTLENAYDFTIK